MCVWIQFIVAVRAVTTFCAASLCEFTHDAWASRPAAGQAPPRAALAPAVLARSTAEVASFCFSSAPTVGCVVMTQSALPPWIAAMAVAPAPTASVL